MTAAAGFMHEQNGGAKGDLPIDLHKMQPLIPLSLFQVIQKYSTKGLANYNALIDDRARAYFSQATDEEYSLYLSKVNEKLKILNNTEATFIGGIHFAANKLPEP